MKTVSELKGAMAARYDGPVNVVRKGSSERTYIPWTAMVRHLNDTFDWDGWGARVTAVVPNDDTYTVALDFEVYVWDERANQVRTIPRPGVSGTLVRGDDASDAAGGARSLALVNGARCLGDAFGLYLTPDKSVEHVASSNGHATQDEPQASEPQKETLRRCKVPERFVRDATKAQASGFLDRIFPDKQTGAYKYGRKFSNDEAIKEVWGGPVLEAIGPAEF